METQNKLEIHHVAKRLPYGLKVLNGWGDLKKLNYAHLDDENRGYISQCKPILFPLSSLTEPMTVKGTTDVIPIDYISTSIKNRQRIMRRVVNGQSLDCLEVWQYERLLELHFDVDNLIEQNLAISVFDLTENPYL